MPAVGRGPTRCAGGVAQRLQRPFEVPPGVVRWVDREENTPGG
jgi:hypothetical protein